MASFGEGDAVKDLFWIIIVFILLGLVWLAMGGPIKYEHNNGGDASSTSNLRIKTTVPGADTAPPAASVAPEPTPTGWTITPWKINYGFTNNSQPNDQAIPKNQSPYAGQVRISYVTSGENTPNTNGEYLTLQADYNNKEPIDISGWQLKNARNTRTYYVDGELVKGQRYTVTLPQASKSFDGTTYGPAGDIVLKPGEDAVITTGYSPATEPRISRNVKLNKCSGYLGTQPGFYFTPSLSNNCPTPTNEAGINNLDQACYNYISGLSNCGTLKFTSDTMGNTLVNGWQFNLDSYCLNFIKTHFNYSACVAFHSHDKDFEGQEWRIFLGQTWPLWGYPHETITLYDRAQKVVDTYSY